MDPLTFQEVSMRLCLALVAGAVMGYERESRGRAAGLKTTILVCMAAAMAMILSEKYYRDSFLELGTNSNWRPDPARLAAGILAGMGFIGGGVIIQNGNVIRGVTTASVLWFVTIIGFCFGSGNYRLGFVGTSVAMVVLAVLPLLEKFVPNDWYGTLSVTATEKGPTIMELKDVLAELAFETKSAEWDADLLQGTRKMTFSVKFKRMNQLELQQKVISALSKKQGITQVGWKS